MTFIFALLPILVVLILMLFFRSGSHQAGAAGWVVGLIVALFAFGLNWQILWVSQVKSLLLTLNVLFVLWPALFLYHLVDQVGGIRAIALALKGFIPDHGWLLVIQAWMLTGLIENVAGFGLPMAIAGPMLVAMGISPVLAVASTAIGHTWAVSTGGMALAFRTLADVTNVDQVKMFPTMALFAGVAVLLTGLAVMVVLGQTKHWWRVVILSVIVSGVLAGAGMLGMIPISSFIASLFGLAGGVLLCERPAGWKFVKNPNPSLTTGILTYGFLVGVIMLITLVKPINDLLSKITWTLAFPEVVSLQGFTTNAGNGYVFHPLVHPGALILLTAVFAIFILPRIKTLSIGNAGKALRLTVKAAIPASLGTVFMIGLSSIMGHTGMTLLLAKGLSEVVGQAFPVFSPLVGMLGAFATGSNVNSNILFGPLQKNVAELLMITPIILLAAQTMGGALGSMVAPAKLAVGGTTSAEKGLEGKVLRITLPIGVGIVVIIGVIAWVLAIMS